jgi:hypothetical protein
MFWNGRSFDLLYKRVTFAASGHRIPVKINKFKLAKGFENLFYIGFGEVEMQRPNI